MCGIIGVKSVASSKVLKLDLTSLQHRGPDSYGEWTGDADNVWFGHTRLAILDTSLAGCQPMKDASGRWVITFNGEIYNHLILREELQGVSWKGYSDIKTLMELANTLL